MQSNFATRDGHADAEPCLGHAYNPLHAEGSPIQVWDFDDPRYTFMMKIGTTSLLSVAVISGILNLLLITTQTSLTIQFICSMISINSVIALGFHFSRFDARRVGLSFNGYKEMMLQC